MFPSVLTRRICLTIKDSHGSDHFLHSRDLDKCFSHITVGQIRCWSLSGLTITLLQYGVKIDVYDEPLKRCNYFQPQKKYPLESTLTLKSFSITFTERGIATLLKY